MLPSAISYSVAEHVAAMNAQISGMKAKGLLGSHLHFAYAKIKLASLSHQRWHR